MQTQSWRVLRVDAASNGGAGDYLVKGLFENAGYHVMLSDSSAIWEEKMEAQDILQRLKVRGGD